MESKIKKVEAYDEEIRDDIFFCHIFVELEDGRYREIYVQSEAPVSEWEQE